MKNEQQGASRSGGKHSSGRLLEIMEEREKWLRKVSVISQTLRHSQSPTESIRRKNSKQS